MPTLTRSLLLLSFLALYILHALSEPSVVIQPVNPEEFFGAGTNMFSFTFNDFHDEVNLSVYFQRDNDDNTIEFLPTLIDDTSSSSGGLGTSSWEYVSHHYHKWDEVSKSAYCFDINNDNITPIATISAYMTSFVINFRHFNYITYPITIHCPLFINIIERGNSNDMMQFTYTPPIDDDDSTGPITIQTSLNLPDTFQRPVITLIDSKLDLINQLPTGQVMESYNNEIQQLTIQFTTNVVDNLILTAGKDLHLAWQHTKHIHTIPFDYYCTITNSNTPNNEQIIARMYSLHGSNQVDIFLLHQTNDVITCKIPVTQSLTSRIPLFVYTSLRYGQNLSTITTNAIDNLPVANISDYVSDFFDYFRYITITAQLGNTDSYITPNSTIMFKFSHIPPQYINLNETYRALRDELDDKYSYCFTSSEIIHSTSYRDNDSIYFTDFAFKSSEIQQQVTCRIYFNEGYKTITQREYSPFIMTVNNQPVYTRNGSQFFYINLSSTSDVHIGNNAIRLPHPDDPTSSMVHMRIQARLKPFGEDNYTGEYLMHYPYLVIAPSHAVYIPYNSLQCRMALPGTSIFNSIELSAWNDGYTYLIPVDPKDPILDHTFLCNFTIPNTENINGDSNSFIYLDDLTTPPNENGFLTKHSTSSDRWHFAKSPDQSSIPPQPDLIPHKCVEISTNSTTNLTNIQQLRKSFRDAVIDPRIVGYASFTVDDVVAMAMPDGYGATYYQPFEFPRYGHNMTQITTKGSLFEFCIQMPTNPDELEKFTPWPLIATKITKELSDAHPELNLVLVDLNEKTIYETYTLETCGSGRYNYPCPTGAACRFNGDCLPGVYCGLDNTCNENTLLRPPVYGKEVFNELGVIASYSSAMRYTLSYEMLILMGVLTVITTSAAAILF